jgi:hypothetical protein
MDDGATIQSLTEELDRKSNQLAAMKKKDFDTLRKQNESISHLQREYDEYADNASDQIQALTAELSRYKQAEAAAAAAAAAASTPGNDGTTETSSEGTASSVTEKEARGQRSDLSSAGDGVVRNVNDEECAADHPVVDEEEFKFEEKESDQSQQFSSNSLEIDLLEKLSIIQSLEQEIIQLNVDINTLKNEHVAEVMKLQDMLLKKDQYITSVKEEQYRQEREIAQLEEVIFEKKQTRQKVMR